jgi:hypothetical protein
VAAVTTAIIPMTITMQLTVTSERLLAGGSAVDARGSDEF